MVLPVLQEEICRRAFRVKLKTREVSKARRGRVARSNGIPARSTARNFGSAICVLDKR
jgi:hypothetical protein